MSNLASGRIIFKFDNSVLVCISSSSLHSNFNVNLYILYESNNWPRNPTNNFPLKTCFLVTVKLVRNVFKSKFTFNIWGIKFDGEGSWSFNNDFVQIVVTFGVYNSSSSHTNNRKNNFLVLGKGGTDNINDTGDVAEKKVCIDFSKANANLICLSQCFKSSLKFSLQWRWELLVYR